MGTAKTLVTYAAALALVFGATFGVGRAVGPTGPAATTVQHDTAGSGTGPMPSSSHSGGAR